jgi:DNA-directed RNA polymerase subunit M/transcription elongation factor TFIIS
MVETNQGAAAVATEQEPKDARKGDRRRVDQGPPDGVERRQATRRATDALKMACPFCGASESAVVRSRGALAVDQIVRRRECAQCGKRFPTFERVDKAALMRELQADALRRRN